MAKMNPLNHKCQVDSSFGMNAEELAVADMICKDCANRIDDKAGVCKMFPNCKPYTVFGNGKGECSVYVKEQ